MRRRAHGHTKVGTGTRGRGIFDSPMVGITISAIKLYTKMSGSASNSG